MRESTIKKCQEIDKLVKEGMTKTDAIKKSKMAVSQYYLYLKHKNTLPLQTSKPQVIVRNENVSPRLERLFANHKEATKGYFSPSEVKTILKYHRFCDGV